MAFLCTSSARVRRNEAETGRRHQAFLRAGHRDVDAPFVHVERHAAERSHGVDHVQRGMAARLDRLADRLDIVLHAGGGIDLDDHDGLDRVLLVAAQPLLDLVRPHRAAPVALEHLDLGAHQRSRMAPADREPPALQHQHLVAARQHVAQRRFPGAVTVGDVDVGFALGRKQVRDVAEQALGQIGHLLGVDVDRRTMHRLQHRIGHRGGPGMARNSRPARTVIFVCPYVVKTVWRVIA